MARWEGNEVRVELPRVVEAHVRIVGGEVAVTAGTGEPRLDAHVLHGGPLTVEVEGGVLIIVHEPESGFGVGLGSISIAGIELPLGRSAGGGRSNRHEAVVTLTVPPDTPVTVRTVNGDAVVAGVRAGASITTVSARVTATDVAGDVALRSVSGDIEAESVDGPVSANTVSGEITVTGRVPELTGHSVSGDMTFDLDSSPEVSLSTVSGDVLLRVPSDATLRLDVTTMSGELDCGFPLEGGQTTRRRMTGEIGDWPSTSARRVGIRTLSGNVAILRNDRASASLTELAER
jgi:hypothetical protein